MLTGPLNDQLAPLALCAAVHPQFAQRGRGAARGRATPAVPQVIAEADFCRAVALGRALAQDLQVVLQAFQVGPGAQVDVVVRRAAQRVAGIQTHGVRAAAGTQAPEVSGQLVAQTAERRTELPAVAAHGHSGAQAATDQAAAVGHDGARCGVVAGPKQVLELQGEAGAVDACGLAAVVAEVGAEVQRLVLSHRHDHFCTTRGGARGECRAGRDAGNVVQQQQAALDGALQERAARGQRVGALLDDAVPQPHVLRGNDLHVFQPTFQHGQFNDAIGHFLRRQVGIAQQVAVGLVVAGEGGRGLVEPFEVQLASHPGLHDGCQRVGGKGHSAADPELRDQHGDTSGHADAGPLRRFNEPLQWRGRQRWRRAPAFLQELARIGYVLGPGSADGSPQQHRGRNGKQGQVGVIKHGFPWWRCLVGS